MNYLLLATIFLAEGGTGTEPVGVPALVPIAIGVILLLLFIWGLNRNNITQGPAAEAEANHEEETAVPEAPAPAEALVRSQPLPVVEATEPDDLKKIEGIGPKIEGILHDVGILTFANLAEASVEHLEKVVREDAGIRVAFPDTWPEQAKLAAASEWDKLETLQDELKGGRRA